MSQASAAFAHSMRAIRIRAPGGPEVLEPCQRQRPQAGPGEVQIKVSAAGVNRPDCLQRQGLYPPPVGASDLPGLEVSGTVSACGDGVSEWQVGDRVCALLAGGGYAEYCVAPAGQCLPIPEGLDFVAAAALPETWFTVWTNLVERGAPAAGERVLIHGGASGIGTTAIQIARERGAEVITTVGTQAKADALVALGATQVIKYREADFRTAIAERIGKQGVDVILDIVGGSYLKDNIKLLNPDGRLVLIGVLGGTRGELDMGRVLFKRLTITGSTLRARSVAEKTRLRDALLTEAWPDLAAGRTRPVIDSALPLAQAAQAHARMEANNVIGKLVLKVEEDG